MSRFCALVVALMVGFVVALATAAPASAHDELLASTPSQGESLSAAPEVVALDFSADMLELGAVISIVDADGTEWIAEEATYEGARVSAVVTEGMPEGGYQIRWRAFSNDGHPISGIIGFTVGDAELLDQAPTNETNTSTSTTTPATTDSPTPDEGPWRLILIGAGGAAAAAGLYALIHTLRRRRSSRRGANAPEHSSSVDPL